jgi:ribonuclease HI
MGHRAAEDERAGVKTTVWADSSCNAKGRLGCGGWAAVVEEADTIRELSGTAQSTTHNRMELTAVCEALVKPLLREDGRV